MARVKPLAPVPEAREEYSFDPLDWADEVEEGWGEGAVMGPYFEPLPQEMGALQRGWWEG